MKTLLLDIEASGLISNKGDLPEQIWCICTEELETGIKRDFVLKECYEDFPKYASQFDKFVAHNAIGYDIPVLVGLTDFKCKLSQVEDTLVYSKILNPDRGKNTQHPYSGPKGFHSLEAWGVLLGLHKGDWEDWSQFSQGMLEYCRNDVAVLRRMWHRLQREKQSTKTSDKAVRLEHFMATYMRDQGWAGFAVNVDKIDKLYDEVSQRTKDLEAEIVRDFPKLPKPVKRSNGEYTITPKYKKNGEMSVVGLKWMEDEGLDWRLVSGPITRVNWVPLDLGSPKQVVERMNRLGWKPYVKTDGHTKFLRDFKRLEFKRKRKKVSDEEWEAALARKENFKRYGWKVCEDNLETLPPDAPPEARKIADFVMVRSKENMIRTQWHGNISEDHRIHGRVDPMGAGTHRMTHSQPNMGNVPRVKKDKEGTILYGMEGKYGYECRDVFTVGDITKQVLFGTDAEQLELRMLAHFMGDPDYTKSLLEEDIHTVNQKAAGLDTRDQAKTFIYGWLYGAGAAKIGAIVGGGYQEGMYLKEQFLKGLPALKDLMDRVQRQCKDDGYVRAPDGRVIWIRSPHAALNTLLQGSGSVVVKWWLHFMKRAVFNHKIPATLVDTVHDEMQWEIDRGYESIMEKIAHGAITRAEQELNLRCALAADCDIGLSWAETH